MKSYGQNYDGIRSLFKETVLLLVQQDKTFKTNMESIMMKEIHDTKPLKTPSKESFIGGKKSFSMHVTNAMHIPIQRLNRF